MTMRVTYYALRDVQVGDEIRHAGDLIPEANDWPFLSGYLADAKIAPVLVATLPEETQVMLLEWEEEQERLRDSVYSNGNGEQVGDPAPEPDEDEEPEEDSTEDDEPVAEPAKSKEKVKV